MQKVLFGYKIVLITSDKQRMLTAILDVAEALGYTGSFSNNLITLDGVRAKIKVHDLADNYTPIWGETVLRE